MHVQPAFRHLHALADGSMVEQVESQVQLQHHLTGLQTRVLDGLLTVEPIPNPL